MASTVEVPPVEAEVTRPSDRLLFRIGAVSGFIGTVLAVVSNAAHPRDFGDSTTEQLRRIADFEPWRIVHLGIVLAVLFGLVTLGAFYRSLRRPDTPWPQIALAATLISAAVALVSFSIDGFAQPFVADEWADATGATKTALLNSAEVLQAVDGGLFVMAILLFFGVVPLLYAIALWESDYPQWLAVVSGLAGAFGVASAVTQFLTGELTDLGFLVLFTVASVLLTVLLLAASVFLWQRSRSEDLAVG